VASELRNEAGTPRQIFETLHAEYGFTVDVCASEWNHKLVPYITKEDDALGMHWGGTRAWCNNPFNDIPPWLAHANEPDFVAFLEPVRSDRIWWMRYKPLAEVHYFVGEKPHRRPQFEPPPGVTYPSNPFCIALMLFGDMATPGVEAYRCGITGERITL